MIESLKGKKAYIIAALVAVYAAIEYWGGYVDFNTALGIALGGGGGIASLRAGMNNAAAKVIVTTKVLPFILVVGMLASLSACGNNTISDIIGGKSSPETETATVQTLASACDVYYSTLSAAADLVTAKVISDSVIKVIDSTVQPAHDLCKGPEPTNLLQAMVNVVALTAKITTAEVRIVKAN